MVKSLNKILGHILIPVAQKYIRYSPFKNGKLLLLRNMMWRESIRITNTLLGSSMKVNTNDLVQGYIYYFGIWEPNLTYFTRNRLKHNDNRTFIDVGANVGYFSLLSAKLLTNGTVVSIEAFPSIYERLLENIHLNKYKNIRSVNVAATNERTKVSMYHAGVANQGATTSIKGKYESSPVIVEGQPLSDILHDAEIKMARLIKIDTEGAEYNVLCGLFPILHLFQDDIEIIVEISPDDLNDKEMEEIFNSFAAQHFFPYILVNNDSPEAYFSRTRLSGLERMNAFPNKQTDIVFSKTDQSSLPI